MFERYAAQKVSVTSLLGVTGTLKSLSYDVPEKGCRDSSLRELNTVQRECEMRCRSVNR